MQVAGTLVWSENQHNILKNILEEQSWWMAQVSSASGFGLCVYSPFQKMDTVARPNHRAANKIPGVCEKVDLQKAPLMASLRSSWTVISSIIWAEQEVPPQPPRCLSPGGMLKPSSELPCSQRWHCHPCPIPTPHLNEIAGPSGLPR